MKTFIEHFYHKEKTQIVTSTDFSGDKSPKNSSQSQILELVELYRIIQAKTGQPETEKLRVDFVFRLNGLDEEKHKMLVEKLLEEKLLPESVGKALKIFGGKLISLI